MRSAAYFVFLAAALLPLAAAAPKPNVLLLLVDDMGFGDVAAFPRLSGLNATYTRPYLTPNIDRLLREGAALTQYTAAPVCTPSRGALLTGRHPVRYGLESSTLRVFQSGAQRGGIPQNETTLFEALKAGGYRTGVSGKWHVGDSNETRGDGAFLPKSKGGDDYLGLPLTNTFMCGSEDSGTQGQAAMCWWVANDTVVQQPLVLENKTVELTNHAVSFIERREDEQPWAYMLSYLKMHTALFTSPAFANATGAGAYADNAAELDWSVGEVLDALDRTGQADNTLVIFMSDNGPWLEEGAAGGVTGGLRGGKAQVWEGGVRVPAAARLPGVIPAGAVFRAPTSVLDMFPTIASVTGVSVPEALDGVDISDALRFPDTPPAWADSRVQFHYCGESVQAVKIGSVKAYFRTPKWTAFNDTESPCSECCWRPPPSKVSGCGCTDDATDLHDPPLLFNLTADPGERAPLDSAALPGQYSVAAFEAAKEAHVSSFVKPPSQVDGPMLPWLQPCCGAADGVWARTGVLDLARQATGLPVSLSDEALRKVIAGAVEGGSAGWPFGSSLLESIELDASPNATAQCACNLLDQPTETTVVEQA